MLSVSSMNKDCLTWDIFKHYVDYKFINYWLGSMNIKKKNICSVGFVNEGYECVHNYIYMTSSNKQIVNKEWEK